MALFRVSVVLMATVVLAHGSAIIPKPKPASQYMGPQGAGAGGPGLGVVVPSMMGAGWGGGWVPTTSPPEVSPGWEEPAPVGWTTTPPPAGWPSVSVPVVEGPVEISMLGEAVVFGAGEAGATHGSEISVSGDGWTPAVASFSSGSYSSLGQGTGVMQISNIDALGESNTFHGIDSYNFGDSGEYMGGNALGTQVDVVGGGGSYVVGEGVIEQGGWTQNSGGPIPSGWKKQE